MLSGNDVLDGPSDNGIGMLQVDGRSPEGGGRVRPQRLGQPNSPRTESGMIDQEWDYSRQCLS